MTEQKDLEDEQIRIRRNKVAVYRRKGLSLVEIADQLKVSPSTIDTDIAFHRKMSKDWLTDMANFGIVDEWHQGLEKLKDTEKELNAMLTERDFVMDGTQIRKDDDGKPVKVLKYTGMDRLRILRLRDENALSQREYLLDGPAVHIMNTHLESGDGDKFDP